MTRPYCHYCPPDDQPDVETMDQLVDHLTDAHDAFSVVTTSVDRGERVETDGGTTRRSQRPVGGRFNNSRRNAPPAKIRRTCKDFTKSQDSTEFDPVQYTELVR